MDSLIANGMTLSINASNLHVEWGTRPLSSAGWTVSGYQDSSCVLVATYILEGSTLTCVALKDNDTYRTKSYTNNQYYEMSVAFKRAGTISIDMVSGGRVTAYMIIGIS